MCVAKRCLRSVFQGLLLLLAVGSGASEPNPVPDDARLPGKQPDGSVLLPNQWSLRPAGEQVELGDGPVNLAVHPDGRYAAVLHSGFSRHEIMVVDLAAGQVASRMPVHETFYGLQFSQDGRRLYCSGGGDEVIHEFKFAAGKLSESRQIRLRPARQTGVPMGMALNARRSRLYVANVWGQGVSWVNLEKGTVRDISLATHAVSSQTVEPASSVPESFDVAAATKRQQAAAAATGLPDPFPYTCLLDEARARCYVSLWGQSAVAVLDMNTGARLADWPTEEHPCEMALTKSGKHLFVANANRNTVTVLDTASGGVLETIWAALYPQSPPGSTPNSLALSPDDRRLFVANANNNTVAVLDVSTPGKSRSLGFIPAGWYPASVRVTPDGKSLLVANGKVWRPGPIPTARSRACVPSRRRRCNTSAGCCAAR